MSSRKPAKIFDGLDKFVEWLTDPKNECSHCKKRLTQDRSYCIWCGNKNDNFDEKEFVHRNNLTLKEAMETECVKNHPEGRGMAKEDHEMIYCSYCGLNLLDPIRIH